LRAGESSSALSPSSPIGVHGRWTPASGVDGICFTDWVDGISFTVHTNVPGAVRSTTVGRDLKQARPGTEETSRPAATTPQEPPPLP